MFETNNIKNDKVIYTACFLLPAGIEAVKNHMDVDEVINDIHMTLEFFGKRECDFPAELFGEEVLLLVDGKGDYKENGIVKNIGLRIHPLTMSHWLPNKKTLKDVFKGILPHITVNVMNGGKPVDTVKCEWQDIKPFTVKAVIGAVTHN